MEDLRARLLQNPAALQQMLQELQATNPQMYQMIQQNPQILMQLLMGGGAGTGAGPRRPRPGGIQVTAEEKAAIERVFISIRI